MVQQDQIEECLVQVYKDDNHKPEMTIAISDFEALCGFVSNEELADNIANYPELRPCLGEQALSTSTRDENSTPNVPGDTDTQQKQKLKTTFTALMTCDQSQVDRLP